MTTYRQALDNNDYLLDNVYHAHHWYGHVQDARYVNLGSYILLGLFIIIGLPILLVVFGGSAGSFLLLIWGLLKIKEWFNGQQS